MDDIIHDYVERFFGAVCGDIVCRQLHKLNHDLQCRGRSYSEAYIAERFYTFMVLRHEKRGPSDIRRLIEEFRMLMLGAGCEEGRSLIIEGWETSYGPGVGAQS